MDVGEAGEVMERVIESSRHRLSRDQETQGGINGKPLSKERRVQIHSVSFPRTVFLRLQGIPHQRRRRIKRRDERTTSSAVDV